MSSTLPSDSEDGLRIVDKVEDNSTSNQMFKSDDNRSLEIRMFEDLAAQQQTMETIRYIAAIVQLLTGIIGIIGTVLSLAVLLRQSLDLKPTYRQILRAHHVADLCFILCNLSMFTLPQISPNFESITLLVPYVYPMMQMAHTGSVYSTLAVAIERYFSVCRPHITPPYYAGNLVVFTLGLFAFAFNFLRFFDFRTAYITVTITFLKNNETFKQNITRPIPQATALRENPTYSQVFMLVSIISHGIIPLFLLIGLYNKVYVAFSARSRRLASMTSRQRRDLNVAINFITVIVLFIACHSFKVIVNMYEAKMTFSRQEDQIHHSQWPVWVKTAILLSNSLILFNSSFNAIIYCYKDKKFRVALFKMIR